MAPLKKAPVLPEKVQSVTVRVPPLAMAPAVWLGVAGLPEKVLLFTIRVPLLALRMAPPYTRALLPEKVLLVTDTVPPLLAMAPPHSLSKQNEHTAPTPLARVRFWTANVTHEFTENTCTVPPPLM